MPATGLGFRFDPEWRITLFTIVAVPLLVALGFWQLERAGEKAQLARAWELRQSQAPMPLASLLGQAVQPLPYTPVTARGTIRESEYLLLDNRTHRGQFGHQVLGIMDLEQGDTAVLVNRGWIAADPGRRSLPEVPVLSGVHTVSGHIYVAPGDPYLLEEQSLVAGWPKLIQAVEMDKIAPAIAARRVFPQVVRLGSDSPGALEIDWRVVNVSPEKHHGYAVQWFTMAAVLAIFYFLRSSNAWELLVARKRRGE